jgi:mannose-6-phosphate isomerase-like protein (cupin superfamily)
MKKKSFIGKESGKPFIAKDGALIYELFRHSGVRTKNISIASGLLGPGQKAFPHLHKKTEEIYYILSGSGKVSIGKVTEKIKPGMAVYVPVNIVHALINTSKAIPLKVLAICSPKYSNKDTFFIVERSERNGNLFPFSSE